METLERYQTNYHSMACLSLEGLRQR